MFLLLVVRASNLGYLQDLKGKKKSLPLWTNNAKSFRGSKVFIDKPKKQIQLLLSLSSSFFSSIPDPGCLADLQIQEPERPSC